LENPRRFIGFFLRPFAVCAASTIILATVARAQPTTYIYSGKPFTGPATYYGLIYEENISSFSPTTCAISGSFTMAQPLPPNFTLSPFSSLAPTSFSFTNCATTITNQNATGAVNFTLTTNAQGEINSWSIQIAAYTSVNIKFMDPEYNNEERTFTATVVNFGIRGCTPGPATNCVGDYVAYSDSIGEELVEPSINGGLGPIGAWTRGPLNCPANASTVFPFAGGRRSTDGFPTAMLATFSPSTTGNPMTLTQAAAECEVTRFDWQQIVTSLPIPFEDAVGLALTAPFNDPPVFGYTYMLDAPVLYDSFLPPSQTYPFYYNPTLVATRCAIAGNGVCTLPITSSNGQTLNFFDSPRSTSLPAGGYFGFTTRLVGILAGPAGPAEGPTFFEWKWISTYNETTGGVQVQTASSVPVDGSGTGGVTITSVNGVPQTPPTATCTATPSTLWPPNGKPVVVTVSGTITAGTSRLVASTYKVIDSYGQVQPNGNITLTKGAYSFGVPLIAARNGDDKDGRTYTIYVTGSDTIGNVGACSAVVTVPHDQGN